MKKYTTEEMKMRKKSLTEVKNLPRNSLILILENLRSAHNVGAIFRTADSTLVEKIMLIGITPVPPSPHLDKSALGATEVVPWQHFSSTEEAIIELRQKNYVLVALEQTHESLSYPNLISTIKNALKANSEALTTQLKIALIVGNEVEGVSQNTVDLCDYSIDIPMYGRASSLNVATATGIVVYDLIRQMQLEAAQNLPKT